MKQGKIYVGTSGWSYGMWKGVFYPQGLKAADYLPFYAQHFSCTEINSSFYHLPRATTVEGWINKVPKQFKFCPKISRYVTHIKRLRQVDEALEKFFVTISLIKTNIGPVLIQLPPSLKFDSILANNFYELLNQYYKDYAFAIEGRHVSWLSEESLQLMQKFNIAFVISQSGVGFPYAEEITARNIYIRFHGPVELFKSSYTAERLQYYAVKMASWRKQGYNLWAFFNNTWYNDAIENAVDLMNMIKQLEKN